MIVDAGRSVKSGVGSGFRFLAPDPVPASDPVPRLRPGPAATSPGRRPRRSADVAILAGIGNHYK